MKRREARNRPQRHPHRPQPQPRRKAATWQDPRSPRPTSYATREARMAGTAIPQQKAQSMPTLQQPHTAKSRRIRQHERTGNNIRKICDHRMPIMCRRRQYHTAKNLTPRTCSCETYRVDQCGRAYGSGRQRNQQQRRSMGAYKHQEHKERQHQRQQQLRFGRDDGNKAQCRKRRRPARKPAD